MADVQEDIAGRGPGDIDPALSNIDPTLISINPSLSSIDPSLSSIDTTPGNIDPAGTSVLKRKYSALPGPIGPRDITSLESATLSTSSFGSLGQRSFASTRVSKASGPKPTQASIAAAAITEIKGQITEFTGVFMKSMADEAAPKTMDIGTASPAARKSYALRHLMERDDGLNDEEKVRVVALFTADVSSLDTYIGLDDNVKIRQMWLRSLLE
jgi:hypothetical protein